MKLPSSSRIGRAMICAPSAILPQTRTVSSAAALRGIEVAAFLEAVTNGEDPTRAAGSCVSSEEGRRFVEVIDVAALPAGMGCFAAEASLGWNPESDHGSAREGIEREHVEGWYTGRADVVGMNELEGVGYVADYKTGRDFVPAAEDWQLRFLALALARTYGLSRVVVEKIWLREDGDNPRPSRAEFDSFALADFASELRALARRLETTGDRMRKGGSYTTTTGPHCTFCPAFAVCPAQVGLIRGALGEQDVPEAVGFPAKPGELTAASVASLWPRVKAAEKALKEMKERMKDFARAEAVALGDGMMLGEKSKIHEDYNGEIAWGILAETIGRDAADRACPVTAGKERIETELREWWRRKCEEMPEGARKPLLKDVLNEFRGALLSADGVTVTTSIEVGEFKKK